MNKFSVFFVFISAFFFAGCSDLLNTQKNNTTTAKITSTEVFEISSTTVDISKKVQPNSKVWVVQYNSGKDGLLENVESTLINSSVVLDNTFSHSESRASFDFQTENPVVFEVPSFVRNYKSNLKPQTELASLKPVFSRLAEEDEPEETEIGDFHTFYFPYDSSADDFYDWDLGIVYQSEYADIYYFNNISWLEDDNYGETFLSEKDFISIGNAFDEIYDAETALMGGRNVMPLESYFISKTPCRVSIVLCDIYGDSTKNQSAGTFGYFDPADLYFNAALENEHSAETQVIYLDSVLYKNYKDTSISVIAHEFNHLLNFVNKEINNNIPSEETWFTEMLSAVAEDLLFDNCLDSLTSYANTVRNNRLPYFNGGYNMGITQTGSSFSQENYGFVLAYGSFLARNYGGPSLINKIATNPYTDEKAITEALKSAGIKKDSKTYVTFEDTLIDFVTSVMNENIDVLNSSVKTLNRSVKGKVANTSFSADGINLSDFYQVVNGKKEKTKGLKTFSSKEKPDVGKYGFILQYAGEGTETLNVVIPEYDELHMYCVIQNF